MNARRMLSDGLISGMPGMPLPWLPDRGKQSRGEEGREGG